MPHFAIGKLKEVYLVGLLAIWLLAGCAGYAACILYTADMHEATALAASFHREGYASDSSQAIIAQLRLGLACTAGVLGALGSVLVLGLHQHGRLPYRGWRIGSLQAWRELVQSWQSLQPNLRHQALALFASLTVLRIIVSRVLVTVDDSASYEFFIRKSLLTVSAYYPAPNNHLFSNTLSWLFYQAYPGYWWSMRVPVLLLSTVGTAGWFLGLLHRSNFRVAILAMTLFSFLEMSLFYAAEGRGYALLMVLSGLGFFCVVALTDPAAEARAGAWAGLAVAGVLGLYTVPTFAYFLVAAYSWLGFCWVRSTYRHRLVSLCLLGATTLLATAFLYAPLFFISGPASLFQNVYVKPLAIGPFFRQLPAYLWQVEGGLMGESHNGVLATIHIGSMSAALVVASFLGLLVAARRGRLPVHQAAYVLRMGVPALWFIVLPYTLLLAQRVQAPGRTLAFKAVFMFLLVGIETDWLLHRFAVRARLLRTGLLLVVAAWIGIQLVQLYRSNELRLSYQRTPHRAAHWLLQQPPGPILAPGSPWFLAIIRFYIHFEEPTSSLKIDGTPRPGVHYRYIINPPVDSLARTPATLPHLYIGRDINCEAVAIIARW